MISVFIFVIILGFIFLFLDNLVCLWVVFVFLEFIILVLIDLGMLLWVCFCKNIINCIVSIINNVDEVIISGLKCWNLFLLNKNLGKMLVLNIVKK